jgi:ankyrin repeat protein
MQATAEFFEAVKADDLARTGELLDQDATLVSARDTNGDSPLLAALYRGHRDVVTLLLERGATVTLHEAAALGETARVAEFLDADSSLINSYSHDGWTPLHLAAFFGHLEAVTALLARGAPVNARSRNGLANQPLHAALAEGSRPEVVRLLLEAGAPVNATQHGGYTPLHEAAQNGYTDLARLLLERGADVTPRTESGETALMLALAEQHTATIALLREHGATE